MSGLYDLTREDLIALVLKLHETIETQAELYAKRIAELEAIVQAQAERISELEEEIMRLKSGKSAGCR